ncbi:hypothetical protein PanWU01x14_093220, partial [Parasponia andersonii]
PRHFAPPPSPHACRLVRLSSKSMQARCRLVLVPSETAWRYASPSALRIVPSVAA